MKGIVLLNCLIFLGIVWSDESIHSVYVNYGDDLLKELENGFNNSTVVHLYLNSGKWGNDTHVSTIDYSFHKNKELMITSNGTVELINYSFHFKGNQSSLTFSNISFGGNSIIDLESSFNSSTLDGNYFSNSTLNIEADRLILLMNRLNSTSVILNGINVDLLNNAFDEKKGQIQLGNRTVILYSESNTQMNGFDKTFSSSLATLQNITMRNNSLTSFDLVGNFTSLEYLDISLNRFSSQFPNLSGAKNLKTLNISRCLLNEELGDNFPSDTFNSLLKLDISNNLLKDKAPSGFLNSPTLEFIDFGNNQYHYVGNFTSSSLKSCNSAGNPFFCPIDWKAFNMCKVDCYNDNITQSFRIRYDGHRNSTSAKYLASRVAIIANISESRINVTREKNQIDADVDILPFGIQDKNQADSLRVVTYLDKLNYTIWATYGIRGVYDVIFPVPPDRTFSDPPIRTGTKASPDSYSEERALAAIGIILLVVAVLFIITAAIILYLKRRNRTDASLPINDRQRRVTENSEHHDEHMMVELEEENNRI